MESGKLAKSSFMLGLDASGEKVGVVTAAIGEVRRTCKRSQRVKNHSSMKCYQNAYV